MLAIVIDCQIAQDSNTWQRMYMVEAADVGLKIKKKLANGELVTVFGFGQLCYPKLVEMAGMVGAFDAVWFDQEHVGLSTKQLEEGARAARATGLDSFARLFAADYASIMRPLEAGVGGIMAAQVRSAQETKNIVQWAKFAPEGQRGVNGTGVDGRYGTLPIAEYFSQANQDTFIAIQIENREGLEAVEDIAAIPGVDVLFIGPADLSQSLGIAGQWDHPEFWRSIQRVADAASAAGIHWAILPPSPAFAKRCISLGCRMLSLSMDVWVFQRGLRTVIEEYKM